MNDQEDRARVIASTFLTAGDCQTAMELGMAETLGTEDRERTRGFLLWYGKPENNEIPEEVLSNVGVEFLAEAQAAKLRALNRFREQGRNFARTYLGSLKEDR